MSKKFTRRQLLKAACYAFMAIILAWSTVLAVLALSGISAEGWLAIGCIAIAGCLLAVFLWSVDEIYKRLSMHGKALCNAAREVFRSLAFVAAGILAWQKIQSGAILPSMLISLFLLVAISERALQAYDQTKSGLNLDDEPHH